MKYPVNDNRVIALPPLQLSYVVHEGAPMLLDGLNGLAEREALVNSRAETWGGGSSFIYEQMNKRTSRVSEFEGMPLLDRDL